MQQFITWIYMYTKRGFTAAYADNVEDSVDRLLDASSIVACTRN